MNVWEQKGKVSASAYQFQKDDKKKKFCVKHKNDESTQTYANYKQGGKVELELELFSWHPCSCCLAGEKPEKVFIYWFAHILNLSLGRRSCDT